MEIDGSGLGEVPEASRTSTGWGPPVRQQVDPQHKASHSGGVSHAGQYGEPTSSSSPISRKHREKGRASPESDETGVEGLSASFCFGVPLFGGTGGGDRSVSEGDWPAIRKETETKKRLTQVIGGEDDKRLEGLLREEAGEGGEGEGDSSDEDESEEEPSAGKVREKGLKYGIQLTEIDPNALDEDTSWDEVIGIPIPDRHAPSPRRKALPPPSLLDDAPGGAESPSF
uniref:Uncharacterized protein n=1 Tax=Chromera velia CCMP2878 TaxID=1169474 RepID=A0A0G4HAP7_9ALVE|eukprot:Cvel_25741.t1-p1 / transcript=Cvel_25741.t1 / gene=Cvel_25741 / organism=Chromera_velia_CCMP2878 / gene_product=hypothetical protein / transcript_product=hypothetical protein / location=Cvel_scaffold2961:5432-9605(-) / protein_length=227 / sequence_SO=supercontig / SO=protein_coding / is_pseudo=false